MNDREKGELLQPFFRRIEARDSLSDVEKRAMVAAADDVRAIASKTDFVREGARPAYSMLILDGIAARFAMVEDGGRQITAFQIAGDFVDLHSFILKRMDHGVTALTDIRVMTFPHERLKEITETQAHLTRVLWFSTLLDGAMHRQSMVSMGRMSGVAHLAHLFCEHYLRAKAAGLADDMSFPFPITQVDLSDALGLSAVHTNRVLRELRGQDIVSWDGKTLQILDWQELQRIAMFDPTFLHLEATPLS